MCLSGTARYGRVRLLSRPPPLTRAEEVIVRPWENAAFLVYGFVAYAMVQIMLWRYTDPGFIAADPDGDAEARLLLLPPVLSQSR